MSTSDMLSIITYCIEKSFFSKIAMFPDLSIQLEGLRGLWRMMVPISTTRNDGQNYENGTQDVINKNDLI